MSPPVKLLAALDAAAQEFNTVLKDKNNPAFKSKYADLGAVLDAVSPALHKHGLRLTHQVQGTFTEAPGENLATFLWHIESGEYLQSVQRLEPVQKTPQGIGSAITYARRYSIMALLCLTAEDDDGAAASGTTAAPAGKSAAADRMRASGVAKAPMKPAGKGVTGV